MKIIFLWTLALLFLNLSSFQSKELTKNKLTQNDPFSTASKVLNQYGRNQGWSSFTLFTRSKLFNFISHYKLNSL